MSLITIPEKIIPPLNDGDRLTRDEFERRYHAMSEVKKAELIEGVVYMPSPVSFGKHGMMDSDVAWLLREYTIRTPGTDSGANSTVRLDMANEPQPDQVLIIQPEYGGRVVIDDGGYINGSPELVIEISGSSAKFDLGEKFKVYRRNQVSEYVVWRVYDDEFDWFVLRAGQYERLEPNAEGFFESQTFPGLWVDATAFMNRDFPRVSEVMKRGLASNEHAEFVQHLANAKKPQ